MASEQLSMLDEDPNQGSGKLKAATLNISKTINAPAQKVYDHWLIPVFVGDWMFGKQQIVKLENKVRKGGEFNYQVKNKSQEISYTGFYELLNIPNKLVFSWKASTNPTAVSRIMVDFHEQDGKTRIKLTVKLDPQLNGVKDSIKDQWAIRCNALAEKFKK